MKKTIVSLVIVFNLLLGVAVAQAASSTTYPSEYLPFDPAGVGTGTTSIDRITLGRRDPVTVTYAIINIILSLLGTAFLVLLLYAGWLWITARGNEEQIKKAKDIILQAVIGFVIILASLGAARLIYSVIYSQFVNGATTLPN